MRQGVLFPVLSLFLPGKAPGWRLLSTVGTFILPSLAAASNSPGTRSPLGEQS